MAFTLDRRGHGRQRVNLLATLSRGREIFSCHVVELSEGGARIALAQEVPLDRGKVRLDAAELGARDAEIVWQKGAEIGLRFTATPKRATIADGIRPKTSRP